MTPPDNSHLPSLFNAVREALKQWHDHANGQSPLRALYLFRRIQQEGHDSVRRVTNQLLDNALKVLQQTHDADAQFLQLRFQDLWPIHRLANHFNVAESTVYTLQRQAIQRLTETLAQMELQATTAQQALLSERLEPATYINLLGVAPQIKQLAQLLVAPGPPWLISLEGIGGIGKTSLADATMRQMIQRKLFDEIGWVSARQHSFNLGGAISTRREFSLTADALIEKLLQQLLPDFTAPFDFSGEKRLRILQARLQKLPHLVVIDNLETLADVENLLPTLQTLSNPSRFLLTSRDSLRSEPNIYHFPVAELSEADALGLIRQEAELSNLPMLSACSDAELRPIIETVGGNPLALRLVVGQSHLYTLESILADLKAARGQSVENLYTYIYRRAWDKLDRLAQQVLLIMPLAKPGGESLDYLAQVGNLEIGAVRMALNQLIMLKLVDARGGLHDRRYSIHSLTRTFLQEQVARWLM